MNINTTSLSSDSDLFSVLVEQIKDYAIFMATKEGRVSTWNEGARRLCGYESAEIAGKEMGLFYITAERESEKPEFDLRMAREMGRYEDEGWRIRKDGSRFWATMDLAPLRDKGGEVIGFAVIIRDSTERKFQEENQQRLLESEERFRFLVDQVKDYAIFILDPRGNITSWNQGARRLKGYTADEVMGKHFSIFYTPEDIARDHPTHELNQAVREGRFEEEGWRVRKDGTCFWASVVITSLWDKRGNLTGFAKVTRDLTQKRKEEEALRRKTEELEAFAQTISHDLRAPLRSISGFAQILKEEGEGLSPTERASYLGNILNSANTMDKLIKDILQLSQLSLLSPIIAAVSMDDVLHEVLRLNEAQIHSTRSQINIHGPLPVVPGNRTLFVQIFSNLLGNAMKFVQEGQTPRIEISVVKKDTDCEIHVRDFGVGIPKEYQQSIFRMFDRGAAEGKFAGSGVGLAIVKKAVERLGGSIAVESEPGEGSDFILTFPSRSRVAGADLSPVNA